MKIIKMKIINTPQFTILIINIILWLYSQITGTIGDQISGDEKYFFMFVT